MLGQSSLLYGGNTMEPLRDGRGLTEAEAIERYRSRNYPKTALTADILIFSNSGDGHQVLLIRRKGHPYLDQLALSGGFANNQEPIEKTAARELEEETGISGLDIKRIGIYSAPGRDPRGWEVSAAYAAVTDHSQLHIQPGDDAADAGWYTISVKNGLLNLHRNGITATENELAFDHAQILKDAYFSLF